MHGPASGCRDGIQPDEIGDVEMSRRRSLSGRIPPSYREGSSSQHFLSQGLEIAE